MSFFIVILLISRSLSQHVQGDLQERVFELRLRPGNQKASKLLKQFIGKNYMGARTVARALHAKMEDSRKADFQTFL